MQVPVNLANLSKLIYKHTQSTGSQAHSCGHSRSAAFGVVVAVVALHVVLQVLSSCCIGVAVTIVAPHMVLRVLSSCHMGVTVTVFALRVVLQSRLLCRMWFRGCSCCAMWVLRSSSLHHRWCCGHGHCATCGFAVAVFMPRVVLQSWLLHHVGVTVTIIVPTWGFTVPVVVLCGFHSHSHCAM